jgi:HAE1 family hydrophobic/amphiphilic exporter-1
MLGSTLLTVVFVPSVFVVLQRFEEWRGRRKRKLAVAAAPTPAAE